MRPGLGGLPTEDQDGSLPHMAGGGDPAKKLDSSSAATGYFPQMSGKRAHPEGGYLQGALDALFGAPENENMSVLDPQGMAYKKAYSAAEPVGMAANLIDPLKALGSIGAIKATPLLMNLNEVKPLVNRLGMNFKDVTKRIPELQESAQRLLSGTGSRERSEEHTSELQSH